MPIRMMVVPLLLTGLLPLTAAAQPASPFHQPSVPFASAADQVFSSAPASVPSAPAWGRPSTLPPVPTAGAPFSLPHWQGQPALQPSPWPGEAAPSARPIDFSSPADDPLLPGDPPSSAVGRLSSHKEGFFQKLSFTGTWLDRSGEASLGLSELELYASFALPLPTRDHPLVITPGFNVRYFDGPLAPDLPPQVFDAYLQFMWLPRLNDRWSAILAAGPGVYSDFEDVDDGAIRVTGKGLARFEWIPERVQLLFGVLYLNRGDVSLLPAGGLIWTPSPDNRFEILFPRPKLAHRIGYDGARYEDWLYVAGEFGGDTWSIQRVGGASDKITLRDLRTIVGLERKLNAGAGYRLEVAYVFARSIEFQSATPDYEPEDTVMLRFGVAR